jgi:hypothetical protein
MATQLQNLGVISAIVVGAFYEHSDSQRPGPQCPVNLLAAKAGSGAETETGRVASCELRGSGGSAYGTGAPARLLYGQQIVSSSSSAAAPTNSTLAPEMRSWLMGTGKFPSSLGGDSGSEGSGASGSEDSWQWQ